jgi:hypothetical protein
MIKLCSPAQRSYHKGLTGYRIPWWLSSLIASRLISEALEAKRKAKRNKIYTGRTFTITRQQAVRLGRI